MLWSNTKISPTTRVCGWGGEITALILGQQGWGRREIVLPCLDDMEIREGINSLSIKIMDRGVPIIVPDDKTWWMLIDCYDADHKDSDGWLYIPESQQERVDIISKGRSTSDPDGSANGASCYLLRLERDSQMILWESSWSVDPLHRGHVLRFDPDNGGYVYKFSLAEALLSPHKYIPEIEEIILAEDAKRQREIE